MQAFTVLLTLALGVFAQQQGQQPAGGQENQAPCPPSFTLQCCQHVISAPDASALGITVDAKKFPGLASKGCANLSPTAQCQAYPVCCKSIQTGSSVGCIPA